MILVNLLKIFPQLLENGFACIRSDTAFTLALKCSMAETFNWKSGVDIRFILWLPFSQQNKILKLSCNKTRYSSIYFCLTLDTVTQTWRIVNTYSQMCLHVSFLVISCIIYIILFYCIQKINYFLNSYSGIRHLPGWYAVWDMALQSPTLAGWFLWLLK